MKLERTGVVLLGLLLMVSAVMSLAAAQDITPEKNILGGQDQACATCSIPETGVVSYKSGSETNLLKEFGIDAPEGSDDAPPPEVGHSNIAGWVTNNDIWSLYNFPTNAKFSVDSWITVDMYGNVQLGTSSDKWLSLSFLPGVNRSSTSGTVGSLLEGPR